jgi:hypothetical protein
MLSPIKVEETGERRADAKRKQRCVEKINKKLFHGFGPLVGSAAGGRAGFG